MSLLINGMNMPENCLLCPCCAHEGVGVGRQYYCQAIDREPCVNNIGRHDDCPLSEIPTPHGRLIDADRLIVALKNSVYANAFFYTPTLTVSQIEQLIEHQPTVIEKEG